MNLLFVHGAGHQPAPDVLLPRLANALFPDGAPSGTVVSLAYYSDILRPLRSAAMRSIADGLIVDPLGLCAAFDARLRYMWDPPPVVVRVIVRMLVRDVYAYLYGGRAHDMQQPVRLALRAARAPCTIVAHSLGSIITMHVLAEPEFCDFRLSRLITVGSPLAIDEIRKNVGPDTPTRLPAPVTAWTNAADPYDPVAIDGSMRGDWYPTDAIEDLVVDNRDWTNHRFLGYLENDSVRALARDNLTR